MESVSGIYVIKNLKNSKLYVGKSVDIEYRSHIHFIMLKSGKHTNKYLQRSYNLHGKDWFSFSILELCGEGILNDLEIYWINKLNTLAPNGYNLTLGGGGTYGWRHSDIAKRKIGDASKKRVGREFSEEHRRNIGLARKNKTYEEVYGKFKAQRVKNAITRANRSRTYKTGWTHSYETKTKMSKSRTGLPQSTEKRKKCRKSKLGSLNPMYKEIEESKILEIVSLFSKGLNRNRIADKFGLSRYLVKRVLVERGILC